MPITFTNPQGVAKPGSRYSHAALVEGPARRLLVSGQIGMAVDGSVADGADAQIAQVLSNLGTILRAHEMTPADVVKVGVFVTDRSLVAAWRTAREGFFGAHAPASTLVIVAGLVDPRLLIEVEIEAATTKPVTN